MQKQKPQPIMVARQKVGEFFPGLSPKTLANWNSLGRGPKPHKFGRKVYYSFPELVRMFEEGSDE